ncbi:MAG TPA: alginate lyase family protein, partial [Terracidiphilus sp.]|nr:alginate lyase family protein [Terracidiphilus sp.]
LSMAEKDPFDKATIADPSASFINVAARRAELAHATTPRVVEALSWKHGCVNSEQPVPPPGRMIIPHHYLSGSYGPINPEEAKATHPYQRFQDAVTDGASRYVATGDSAEAVCVANLLSQWAAANALLDYSYKESSQAWYQVEWTLSSISLAWSVVQNDPAIPAAQRTAILKWMHKVTEYMFDQDPHPDDHARENNHAYWRALCATSVGILTSDENLYRRGLSQYARAIGQMNSDGSLPLEMARHENALHYQSFALAPLVMIAELASRQGVDLYSLRVNGHTIADAVDFLVRASADLSLVKKYASEPQTFSLFSGKKPPAWTEFWAARHPGKPWSDIITVPLVDSTIGGNATIYAAPAQTR